MTNVLVTGGAGFIGSHLVEKLIEEKNTVVVVDDLSMGSTNNLPESSYITFYKHSISDSEFLRKIITSCNFDYIYLLAAVASVADTIARPIETHEINQNANIRIFDIVRTIANVNPKIIFASSAAVYGNLKDLPKTELSPVDPKSPYAVDKYASEKFLLNYGSLYGLRTAATRFFNVYGPRQNPNSPYSGVLSIVSSSLINDSTFKLFGDGSQTRDFVNVKDVIDALLIIAHSEESNGEVYNVGTGVETKLINVISIFERLADKNLNMVLSSPRSGDIMRSVSDISKLESLGYIPKYKLEDGLKNYWNSLIME